MVKVKYVWILKWMETKMIDQIGLQYELNRMPIPAYCTFNDTHLFSRKIVLPVH